MTNVAIAQELARRPWWMTALMLFCIYMAAVRVPRDLLFTPIAVDEEVWFGIVFYGAAAKILEVAHWLVYAAGAYGFWRMRRWMWPWAALYTAQVAISAIVWPLLYRHDARGLITGTAFAAIAVALWRAHSRFEGGK